MIKPPQSIRWRFVLWLAFLLICILTGFGFTAYQLHRTNRFDQLDDDLERRVNALSIELRTPPNLSGRRGDMSPGMRPPPREPPPDWPAPRGGPPRDFGPGQSAAPGFGFEINEVRLSKETLSLFDEREADGFYYVLWSRDDGSVLKHSTNAPTVVSQPERPGRDTGTRTRTRGTFREAFHYTERGNCILAGRSIVAELQATRRFAAWLAVSGLGVLAFGVGISWWLASRALRPVSEISAAATRISAGNLSERINVANTDNELGQLANTLNSTFARLEGAFAQQKQFTADASHELRTPLAVLISESQTTLARERTAAEYRSTVEGCLATAQQMRQLTESLLQLARLDAGREDLRREKFDLAASVRKCVARVHPLAKDKGITTQTTLGASECVGDADRLAQVVTNLLTNAIQYNRPGGEVRVNLETREGVVVLTVADNGPGIHAQDMPRVFERFFRADKARSTGGNGLGLAISKAIVEAHGGTIDAASADGSGATFIVRLPILQGG